MISSGVANLMRSTVKSRSGQRRLGGRAAPALLVVLLLAIAGCGDEEEPFVRPDPPDHPLLSSGFLNIAHRGGGTLAPEETLVAYHNALAVGADVLEMDVRMTGDGVLVLLHDNSVDRTTDGTGVIAARTYAEIAALDAGYRYTPDGGESYPYRDQGVVIPRFADVLEEFPEQLFAIEIKETDIVDEVVAVIEQTGSVDRVVVAAFADSSVLRTRALNPAILTALTLTESFELARLTPEEEARWIPPAWILQTPTDFGEIIIDQSFVDRAHGVGVEIQLWTINDPDEMTTFLDMGVDGIMTDDPETLESLIGAH